MDIEFKDKYLKYKKKYLDLKNLIAGDYTTGYGCLTCRDKEAVIEGLFTARGGILNPELFLKIANENPPGEDDKQNSPEAMMEKYKDDEKIEKKYLDDLKKMIDDNESKLDEVEDKIREEYSKIIKTGKRMKELEDEVKPLREKKEKLLKKKPSYERSYNLVVNMMSSLGKLKDFLKKVNKYKKKAIDFYKENKFIEKTEDGKIKIYSTLFEQFFDEAFYDLVHNIHEYYLERENLLYMVDKSYYGAKYNNSVKKIPLDIPSYILSSDEVEKLKEELIVGGRKRTLRDTLAKLKKSVKTLWWSRQPSNFARGDPGDIIFGQDGKIEPSTSVPPSYYD